MNFKTLLYIHILKIKTKSSRQNHVIFKFSSHFAMFSCSSPRDDMTLRRSGYKNVQYFWSHVTSVYQGLCFLYREKAMSTRLSHTLEIFKIAHVRGCDCFFTVLAKWQIMTNRTDAKNNGDRFLYSILWPLYKNIFLYWSKWLTSCILEPLKVLVLSYFNLIKWLSYLDQKVLSN
jgi:hypothetical protein